MEKETKRQWMQSFEGRIRVGPQYQAMIPPFCRNNYTTSQYRLNSNDNELTTNNIKKNNDGYMQSYVNNTLIDESSNEGDILNHLKFGVVNSNEESPNDTVIRGKSILNISNSKFENNQMSF